MPEAKEEESEKKNANLIYLGILVAIAIIAIVFFSKFLTWIAVGAFIGLVIAVFSGKTSTKDLALYMAIFAVIGGFLFAFGSPLYAEVMGSAKGAQFKFSDLTQGIMKPFECLLNTEACQKKYANYDASTVQEAVSKVNTKVSFLDKAIRENQPLDVKAELAVMNQIFDNLRIDASCSVDNVIKTAEPASFVFEKSTQEQYSTLSCKGDFQKGELAVKLRTQYKAETVLTFSIGGKEKLNKPVSEMLYDSPYKLSIGLSYNQPLLDGDYIMLVVLEKQKSDSTISGLDSLKLSTKTERASISCEDFNNMEINNLDRNSLKAYLKDPNKDLYMWECALSVSNAGDIKEDAYIKAEAIYTAESEYKTTLQIIK
jgi:hypothetical protein